MDGSGTTRNVKSSTHVRSSSGVIIDAKPPTRISTRSFPGCNVSVTSKNPHSYVAIGGSGSGKTEFDSLPSL